MPASRCAALDQHASGQQEGDESYRDVHEEHQAPARGRDQQAAERRADAGCQRGDGRPQRDRVHALARLVRLEHDRQRARHERAAPAAWIARAAISMVSEGETAHSADASVNSSSASENTRRRPSRSAS